MGIPKVSWALLTSGLSTDPLVHNVRAVLVASSIPEPVTCKYPCWTMTHLSSTAVYSSKSQPAPPAWSGKLCNGSGYWFLGWLHSHYVHFWHHTAKSAGVSYWLWPLNAAPSLDRSLYRCPTQPKWWCCEYFWYSWYPPWAPDRAEARCYGQEPIHIWAAATSWSLFKRHIHCSNLVVLQPSTYILRLRFWSEVDWMDTQTTTIHHIIFCRL